MTSLETGSAAGATEPGAAAVVAEPEETPNVSKVSTRSFKAQDSLLPKLMDLSPISGVGTILPIFVFKLLSVLRIILVDKEDGTIYPFYPLRATN